MKNAFKELALLLLLLLILPVAFYTHSYISSAAQTSYPDGTLIRAKDDYRIYTVFDNKKRWIKNIDVFDSYEFEWNDIKVLDSKAVEKLLMNNLVRVEGSIEVYALNDNGYKRHIKDPDVFDSYGFKWSDIAPITNVEIENYPENRLVREVGNPKVYLIENGEKLWIDSSESFYRHNFNWDEIHIINSTDINSYQSGETITASSVIAGDISSVSISTSTEIIIDSATTTPATTTTTIPAIPAIPATPAVPATPGSGGGVTTPATPAVPAVPATSATTTPDIDTPPVISNIQTSATTASSTIVTWTTDESADGKVNFGLSSSAMNSTEIAFSDAVTSHTVQLSNLSSETTYYYTVVSADASDNTATSDVQSFTTLGLPRMSSWENIRITNTSGEKYFPTMIWDGSGYGIVWNDDRDGEEPEIYFARADENGTKIVSDVKISNNPNKISYSGDIVWTGSEYGIVWSEYSRYSDENDLDGCYLYFARVNSSGNKIGDDVLVTSDDYGMCPSSPSMVWTGSEYGITWGENRVETGTSRIFFARLNSDGVKQGGDVQASNSTASGASLVWNGSEYAVFWGSRLAKLNAGGVKESEISLDVNASSAAWNGSSYGVTWTGYSGGTRQIFFAKLDQSGNQQGSDVVLTSNSGGQYSTNSNIVAGNSGYGITWYQSGDIIYFVNVDADGNKLSAEGQISNAASGQAMNSQVAWGGSKYAVVWNDSRHGGTEIYFAASPNSMVRAPSQTQVASIWLSKLNSLLLVGSLISVLGLIIVGLKRLGLFTK